jgi:hypothetical protein
MAEMKTKPTGEDVVQFLNAIVDEKKRHDSFTVMEIMREVTQEEPKLWASSMVGFCDHHYKYESGREGDTFLIGFAPRKGELTLYGLRAGENAEQLLEKLGKFKSGKGCLYIKRIEDIDLSVLRQLIRQALENKSRDQA